MRITKEVRGSLIERIKRTPTVESFRFLLEERLNFLSGQFLQLIFDEKNKNNISLNKFLSISSSPTKDYIEITKRLSESDFSRRLNELRIADKVLFKLPLGECVFKDGYKKIGFLIGGIGITPVISILEYIMDKALPIDVVLLYSNSKGEEIAFRKGLDVWGQANSNIKVFYTLTDCLPKDDKCLFGFINQELLLEKVKDYSVRIFFIFGPPKMVETMRNLCIQIGCKKENIKTESFIGY